MAVTPISGFLDSANVFHTTPEAAYAAEKAIQNQAILQKAQTDLYNDLDENTDIRQDDLDDVVKYLFRHYDMLNLTRFTPL